MKLIKFEDFELPMVVDCDRPKVKETKYDLPPFMCCKDKDRYVWEELKINFKRVKLTEEIWEYLSTWFRSYAEGLTPNKPIKKNITIDTLDSENVVIERWNIQSCKIESIDIGSLDASNDDILLDNVTISFKNAILIF